MKKIQMLLAIQLMTKFKGIIDNAQHDSYCH